MALKVRHGILGLLFITYVVPGSKTGAAAAAVWLSKCVIGMGRKGMGRF
jgi:hypothetical protein